MKTKGYSNVALRAVSTPVEPKVSLSIDQKTPSDWDKVKEVIEEAKASKKPPIYQPGSYIEKAIAASAYLIPLVDATDLGKYMFEAYPDTGLIYNSIFGPISGVYNGVPFLSFAVFFIMSYISRAPSFPVEIRFHFAQAFMIALVQFVPTLLLGALEKAGVPGLAILYNTGNFLNIIEMYCIINNLMYRMNTLFYFL